LRAERDEFGSQLRICKDAESSWQNRSVELESHLSASMQQLSTAIADRDSLTQDRSTLQSQVDTNQNVLAELQQKLAIAASELMSNTRQLHTTTPACTS